MKNDYKDTKFQKLLNKLQQESWQLELLISGFAIFGLFSTINLIEAPVARSIIDDDRFKTVFLFILFISCYILIFNLLIHVILRGLWIGALGLRYISGDIDFKNLKYQDKFDNYLKKKIVSFDKYVATLENYCSIMFAISFLLIFYLISVFIILFVITFILNFVVNNDNLHEITRNIIGYILLTFVGIGTLLTLIDFFSQGFLKKKKILAKIYFPFYWIFSYFTLSFLYRPLVYNFLDNKFGKRVSLFLVPIYILIFISTSLKYNASNYLDKNHLNNSIYMNNENYEDMLINESDFVKSITIQSKVIKDNYIKVFCVFNGTTENKIFKFYPKIKPESDERGYTSQITFSNDLLLINKKDSLTKKYLEVYNEMYTLYVDSLKYNSDFLITKNIKNQLGFETYLNIKNIPEGKHLLKLKRKNIEKKDTILITETNIPFWYYKQ
jgi:hypothetical protein